MDHCTCSGWRCRAGACWAWMPLGTCWRHVPKTPFLPVPVLDAATYASRGTHVKIASISCQMLCPTLIHTWLFASAQVFMQQTHFFDSFGTYLCTLFSKARLISRLPENCAEPCISQTCSFVSFCQLRYGKKMALTNPCTHKSGINTM